MRGIDTGDPGNPHFGTHLDSQPPALTHSTQRYPNSIPYVHPNPPRLGNPSSHLYVSSNFDA